MAYACSLCTELANADRVLKSTNESLSRPKAELEKWKHESVLRDDDFVDQELFYQVCDQAQVVSDEVKVLRAQLAENESSAYEVHDLRNEVLRMNCIIIKLQETIVPIADLDASNRAVASDAPYMHLDPANAKGEDFQTLVSQAVTVDLKERRKTVIPKGTPPGDESFDIGDGDGGPGDDDDDDGDYSSEDDDVEELPERNGSDADSVNGRLFYADGTESEIHKGKKKKDLIRHKEEAIVVCPPFPSGTQLLAWRIQVAKNLAAASGRWDHKEIRWFFLQGSGEGGTFDSLRDSGELRFRSLDIKLSTAMGKVVRSGPLSLAAELQLKEHQAVLMGGP